MNLQKWAGIGVIAALLALYNGAQPDLQRFRTMDLDETVPITQRTALEKKQSKERYGPSLQWLDRLAAGNTDNHRVKLDFSVLSSMMIAGLASGFKSQVANLLWMKSDEYWHQGLFTRQIPLMEAVVTLDPQFIDAWSTAGWHWAYNIYADIQSDPRYKDPHYSKLAAEKDIRTRQDTAIDTGLDYLKRGSEMNPDTYRLWFEWGWTRAEKAGYYDDTTVDLFRTARKQGDARNIERDIKVNGKMTKTTVQGLDIVGRTIGHIYEKIPDFDKALDMYADDLLHLKGHPAERAKLDDVGHFWHLYGPDYEKIGYIYSGGDATIKAQVKALVPDVDKLVAGNLERYKLAGIDDGGGGQPTGAYVTIVARYIPSWNMEKQAKAMAAQGNTAGAKQEIAQAIATMNGVMNADTQFHMPLLPVLAKVLELRGDSPTAIAVQFKTTKSNEMGSSQDIGLHFMAKLYEYAASIETDPAKKTTLIRKAYETWFRSKERDSLDFYSNRQTLNYKDKYNFTDPQEIIDQVKQSRKSGNVNAAPPVAPNVEAYYQ